MSYIDMHARHSMSREDAQAAADQLASDLARKFDIDFGWEGDHIHFERPGVNGTIMVREREIRIEARLGLMLMFLKPQIENEITRYLRDHFGCTFV
jgi:putative polyhydroxyalkanoate system protein